ncbi:glycoside hydrolase family 3 N-terminal domain-containing protein [uncultured Arcticibacterium sp.]|uniref:glycoside hydrolase family 3 N-terminal domain-containing protein n=1 Tax=uncultured Arcticibacterium sp. TaxID=2173042 RepID=UPI0030F9E3A7
MNQRVKPKLLLLILFIGVFTLSFIGSDLQFAASKGLEIKDDFAIKTPSSLRGNTVLKKNYDGIKDYIDGQYAWADSVLAGMSLEEKVGQLFMIATYSNRSEKAYQVIREKIKKYHLGGLIFFQGTAPVQARLTNEYQELSKIPLMIGMDAEWGLGMRLSNTTSFPKQITLGAIENDALIEAMGYEIGSQLKRLGVHINFAPVADINTNPKNPVINYRSFGESQNLVADKAMAYAAGLKKAGVMAVAKHFPGHGDTGTDSHVAMPVVNHSKKRLSEQELVPFRRLINDSIAGVMTGHLFVPSLDNSPNRAATISEKIVKGLLQEQLGFRGLTFTDALNMRGITNQFSAGGADLAAYKAGNDVLLQTANLDAAYNKILGEFRNGNLEEEELDRRVHRILRAKYWAGLNKPQHVRTQGLMDDLNSEKSRELNEMLYKNAVTVLRADEDVFPFVQLDTLTIGTVAVSAPTDNEFQSQMSGFGKVVNYEMPIKPGSSKDWDYIVEQAFSFDAMVVSIHDMNSRSSRNFGVSPSTIDMIRALSKKTKVVVVAFGNPYGLKLFDEFPNVICGFEDEPMAYRAVAEVLFGAGSASGRLPVTASPMAKYSFGKKSQNVGRLTEDLPGNVGMDGDKLNEIDGIIDDAISRNSFPGAQVLVARRGKVVYHKAFGTYRYGNTEKVTTNTLYDLASLTKVSATLQAVMMLNEKGLLNLNLKASDYLPELKGTNKADMIVGDILFHQAGLKSFQAFWTHTKTSGGAFKKEFYQDSPVGNLQVAENLYIKPSIRDSVWSWLIDTDYTTRRKNRSGEYRYLYSDLGLIMMQRIVEEVTGQPMDEFLDQNLYEPLGMTHTLFNPLNRFSKKDIAPTENDQIFRKEQIWGTVHDPNAALLGGVAGHAGLFSNAWDLAKLYQMNLQNGSYGGRRYLFPETVHHFASHLSDRSHRGIGWNKPVQNLDLSSIASSASPDTYGHTGFTGTVVWVDPDRQLIFIMLANRVYPRANNHKLMDLDVRKRIHEVINEAVDNL